MMSIVFGILTVVKALSLLVTGELNLPPVIMAGIYATITAERNNV